MVPIVSFAGLEPWTPADDPGLRRVAAAVRQSCIETGMFCVIDHAIPAAAFRRVLQAARLFFSLPAAERRAIRADERHRGGDSSDREESFDVGVDLALDNADLLAARPLRAPDEWPRLGGFREPVVTFFEHLMALGFELLRVLSVSLGRAPDFLARGYGEPTALMRLLHDPADAELREAEHTDPGMITLLAQDELGGLEMRDGSAGWVAADPAPGGILVTVGDYLSDLTNGIYRAAPHRVINRTGEPRCSIPLFFDPALDAAYSTLPDCIAAGGQPRLADARFGAYLLRRRSASHRP